MNQISTLLSLGLLSCSLVLQVQQSAPKPDQTTPAQKATDATVPPAADATSQMPQTTQSADQTAGAAAPAGQEPAPVTDLDPDYTLGTDDGIMVHVWKEPTISGPLVIRPDGKVSLPLIGDLKAAGLTPMALAEEITTELKKFINDPSVVVTVTAVNSRKIYFTGEIARGGAIPLTRSMSMLQAIAAAGGLSPYANQKKIYILRTVKGKTTKIPFDYKKALKTGDEQGVVLTSGDTIVVP
jgi:polysaccharide export outer membrane protein